LALDLAKEGDKVEGQAPASTIDSHIILCVSSTLEHNNYTSVDFNGLRDLLIYGKCGVSAVLNGNKNADALDREKRSQDSTNRQLVFQVRDITNQLSLPPYSHPSPSASSQSYYSATLDKHPNFFFLSELLHSPLYHQLAGRSSRIFSITAHPRTFPLEIFCLNAAAQRLCVVMKDKLYFDASRTENNYFVHTLKLALNNVHAFAQILYTLSRQLVVLFLAQAEIGREDGNEAPVGSVVYRVEDSTESSMSRSFSPADPFGFTLTSPLDRVYGVTDPTSSEGSSPSTRHVPFAQTLNEIVDYAVKDSTSPDSQWRFYQHADNVTKFLQRPKIEVIAPATGKYPPDDASGDSPNVPFYQNTVVKQRWAVERAAAFLQQVLYRIIVIISDENLPEYKDKDSDGIEKAKKERKKVVAGRVSQLLKTVELFATEKKGLDLVDPIPTEKIQNNEGNEESKTRFLTNIGKLISNYNMLGPVVFVCPELGKWTTAGGLGMARVCWYDLVGV
jgi:hypothetical protein